MTTTHTPGPWTWEAADSITLILHPEDSLLEDSILSCDRCESCAKNDKQCNWPSEANAHLIAAAPTLYDAAMAAVDRIGDYIGGEDVDLTLLGDALAELEDAIAKATFEPGSKAKGE